MIDDVRSATPGESADSERATSRSSRSGQKKSGSSSRSNAATKANASAAKSVSAPSTDDAPGSARKKPASATTKSSSAAAKKKAVDAATGNADASSKSEASSRSKSSRPSKAATAGADAPSSTADGSAATGNTKRQPARKQSRDAKPGSTVEVRSDKDADASVKDVEGTVIAGNTGRSSATKTASKSASSKSSSSTTEHSRQGSRSKNRGADLPAADSDDQPSDLSLDEVTAFITSLKSGKKTRVQENAASAQPARYDLDERAGAASEPMRATSDEAAANGDAAPISRREKRRLEWIEKRRQWRDQKKAERQQRRTEPGAEDADGNVAQEHGHDTTVAPGAEAQSESRRGADRDNQRGGRRENQRGGERESQRGGERDGRRDAQQGRDARATEDRRNQPRDERHRDAASTEPTAEDAAQEQQASAQREGDGGADDRRSRGRGGRRGERGRDRRGSRQDADVETEEQSDEQREEKREQGNRGRQQSQRSRRDGGSRQASGEEQMEPLPKIIVAEDKLDQGPPPKRYFVYKDITKKPELDDDVARLVERVEHYLLNELLVEDGEVILVGVSGGVDSVVLLDILHVLSFEHGYTLYVAHVNHGLRGADAKRDEKFVRALAQKYDIQCHSTTVQVKEFAKKHSLTEEAAGRELRYKFFRQTCSTLRAGVCATAHTADDAAETLLMNLFRGTGLSGLAGIPPRRMLVKKTQLVRPLLQVSKDEILEYAEKRELEWYEDETNTITTYTRNKVRHEVLPKLKEEFNPKIVESLNRTATLLRKADGFIESFIDSTFHSVVVEKEDSCVIDINKLEVLHEFLQSEIIERCISTLTFGRTVSFASMDRIISLLGKESGSRENIVNNLIALRNRNEIVLMYEQHLQEVFLTMYKLGEYSIGRYTLTLEECHRNDVRIGQDRHVEYFDYDRLPYRLTLRTWHAGDVLHALGLNGHVKISDLLTNEKVEHQERPHKLVLATATDIVWACGIRMSEDFKITNETRRIVRATFSDKG